MEEEKGKVKLTDIVYDPKIYPREKWNTNTVNEYVDALRGGAEFPAITLEKSTNRLLDGVHRWKAYQQYLKEYQEYKSRPEMFDTDNSWTIPQEEISAVWCDVPKDIPIKLFTASLSAKHGDRISTDERKALTREIFTENPDFTIETIVKYIGGSKSSVAEAVKDIRAARREEQKMTAYRLHRLGWTDKEIADTIGCSESNYRENISAVFPELENTLKKLLSEGIPHGEIAKRYNMPLVLVWAIALSGLGDLKRFEALNITCNPYDVWNFGKCHELFGSEYPGRIPGQLIAHAIYFFTEPGAVILDPMSGSGTTQDVCLAFNRKCYAYDIENKFNRSDVIINDLDKNGWPDRIKKANLIFFDPPYFKKKDSETNGPNGYGDSSISKLSKKEYLEFFGECLKKAKSLVKKGTYLCFLMSDWNNEIDESENIFIWDYANLILEANWRLIRHIQVPLGTQQVHADIVLKFRESKRLARLERYLLVAQS